MCCYGYRLAAKLLQRLCHERECQNSVQEHQGIPILLSQLHCDNVNLLLPVLQCLIHLCANPEANKEIRQMGGIPTILALLRSGVKNIILAFLTSGVKT